jgi:hypothetical protein
VTFAPPFGLIAAAFLLNSLAFELIDRSDHEIMETQLTFEQSDVLSHTGRALDEISKKLAEIMKNGMR